MAAFLPGDISQNGAHGVQRHPEMSEDRPGWYFTRKEIEESSPSKRDGIDWKKETYLRRSYCTFLQDLGMRLSTSGNLCHSNNFLPSILPSSIPWKERCVHVPCWEV